MNDFWLPLLPFTVFFTWLLLFGMRRSKPCPDCGKPLPSIQSPFTKTKRQWFEGGYMCGGCGCEADTAGNKVADGAAPKRMSIITGIGLLALAAVPAIILLTALFRR